MTDKILNVHQAIVAVSVGVGAVGKGGMQQGFAFRGIDDVLNAVSPVMRTHGLTLFPSKVERIRGSSTFKGGGTANVIDLVVDYTFTGPDGSQIVVQVASEATDSLDKATAKAMSVALRTCLIQTFAIPTVEETGPDWNQLFNAAVAKGKDALIALRNQGKQANAPANMFPAIEQALANIPVEGNVQQ